MTYVRRLSACNFYILVFATPTRLIIIIITLFFSIVVSRCFDEFTRPITVLACSGCSDSHVKNHPRERADYLLQKRKEKRINYFSIRFSQSPGIAYSKLM